MAETVELSHWLRNFVVATERDCQARWCARNPGEMFRCYFCGHHFVVGDEFRAIFTNYQGQAPGNPFTCRVCFERFGREDGLRQRWKEMNEELRRRFWWKF